MFCLYAFSLTYIYYIYIYIYSAVSFYFVDAVRKCFQRHGKVANVRLVRDLSEFMNSRALFTWCGIGVCYSNPGALRYHIVSPKYMLCARCMLELLPECSFWVRLLKLHKRRHVIKVCPALQNPCLVHWVTVHVTWQAPPRRVCVISVVVCVSSVRGAAVTGASRRYAFVEYESSADANHAVKVSDWWSVHVLSSTLVSLIKVWGICLVLLVACTSLCQILLGTTSQK